MFKFIKTFRKWDKHHRGVSPVIAAIAGAAVFFIVLPLLSGAADVELSSITATDANDDSLVDTIKLTFTNKGTIAVDITNVDLSSLAGWSVTSPTGSTVAANPGTPVVLTLRPAAVGDQILVTDSLSIGVTIGDAEFTITQSTSAEDGKSFASDAAVKSISAADLKVTNYDTANWAKTSTDSDVELFYGEIDSNRETASGSPGIRFRTDNNDVSYFFNSDQADGTPNTQMADDPAETTSWSESTPVVGFWIKSDTTVDDSSTNIRVYFEAYSGSTDIGDRFYYDLEPLFDASSYTANEWILVVLDLTDTSLFTDYEQNEIDATVYGGFALYVDNDEGDNWDVYIDDIFVADGL
jgi:hypothetical protein